MQYVIHPDKTMTPAEEYLKLPAMATAMVPADCPFIVVVPVVYEDSPRGYKQGFVARLIAGKHSCGFVADTEDLARSGLIALLTRSLMGVE